MILLGVALAATPTLDGIAALEKRVLAMRPLPERVEGGGGVPPEAVLASVADAHPTVLGRMAEAQAARAKLTASRGFFDPRLDADLTTVPAGYYDYTYFDAGITQATPLWGLQLTAGYRIGLEGENDFSPYNEVLETLDAGEVRVEAKLPLLKGGPIDPGRAELRQSRLSVEEAQAQLRAARLGVAIQALDAYWKWRAAAVAYDVLRSLAALTERRDQLVKRRIEEGTLPELERAESLRAVLDRRNDALAAYRDLQNAGVSLSIFLRTEDGLPFVPSPEVAPGMLAFEPASPVESERIPNVVPQRPEAVAFQQKVAKAEIETRLRRNEALPKVDAKAALSKDVGEEQFEEDEDRFVKLDPTELKLGLSVQFPVLLRKGRGIAAQARSQLQAVERKAQLAREKLAAELRKLAQTIDALDAQAAVARNLQQAAEIAADAARRRFEIGTADLFDVFLRESKAAEASVKAAKVTAARSAARMVWALSTCQAALREDLEPC